LFAGGGFLGELFVFVGGLGGVLGRTPPMTPGLMDLGTNSEVRRLAKYSSYGDSEADKEELTARGSLLIVSSRHTVLAGIH
jgi:hypothetical protein